MSEPHLHCRAAGLDLLLPSTGLCHLAAASDLRFVGEVVVWNDQEFATVVLRDRLVAAVGSLAGDAVALFDLEGERLAVVADRFVGLQSPDGCPAWTVPHLWLLRGATFPYRRFVLVEKRIAAEVAVMGLGLPRRGSEARASQVAVEALAPRGTYLLGWIGPRRVALHLPDVVELVSDVESVAFPGLPRRVRGFAVYRERPIPVLRLGPDEAPGALVVLRARNEVFALALRAAEGLAELESAGIGAASLLAESVAPDGAEVESLPPVPLLAESIWALI